MHACVEQVVERGDTVWRCLRTQLADPTDFARDEEDATGA
jgi:hypothetical protein